MSHLVTVTNHFLAITLRDITLYVVNNHRIARTIFIKIKINTVCAHFYLSTSPFVTLTFRNTLIASTFVTKKIIKKVDDFFVTNLITHFRNNK